MSAEQFLDAVWMLTRPPCQSRRGHRRGPVRGFGAAGAPLDSRIAQKVRRADALTRPAQSRASRHDAPRSLTTLQALDLSNGQVLTDLLTRGAAGDSRCTREARAALLWTSIRRRWSANRRRPSGRPRGKIVGDPMTADGVADLLWIVVMLPEFQLIR